MYHYCEWRWKEQREKRETGDRRFPLEMV